MGKIDLKNQPAGPTFLAVAIPFVVQGDWTVAFCRQLFFLPGPKAVELNSTKCNQLIYFFNLILNSVYALYFNLNVVFLCFLFFVFPSFFLFLFNCPFCSTVLFLFLSWSSRCSNLAITLAITLCWKRNPGRGIDWFDPNKKNSTKKRTGSQP